MDLSVEEANKLRKAMGLPLLPGPGGAPAVPTFKQPKEAGSDEPNTVEARKAKGYENWNKYQAELEAKAKREAKKEAIRKAREKASRFAKLEGVGLAEVEEDLDDRAWLMQSKKRQKKAQKAQKLQEQREEEERKAAAARQYTESDLAGVKVAHELDAFGEGEAEILVLKDTAVDADEDDELEAVALKEKERLQERLDLKKRKRVYDPNDEDGQGTILAQYDEEIEGKKRKVFTLDGQGRTVEEMQMLKDGTSVPKKVAVSLDILKDEAPVSDYMDISEIKIKNPKKKKSKTTKKRPVLDDNDDDLFPAATSDKAEDGAMDIDQPKPAAPKTKKVVFEDSLLEDSELQLKLAKSREAALRKRTKGKVSSEELAQRIREPNSATPDVMDSVEDEDSESSGLIIDETREFVERVDPDETPRHRRASSGSPSRVTGDVSMEDAENGQKRRVPAAITNTTGLDDELTVGNGIGATLRLLRERGLIEGETPADSNALYRQRQKFLADKRKAEEAAERLAKQQRERDKELGRLQHMTPRERELYNQRANATRDQQESRRLAEVFNREYKPDVQLNYTDEYGRPLNPKEAFKNLSHQ
jgi:U4/U6.U5 tri-snRNP-associated protein 1